MHNNCTSLFNKQFGNITMFIRKELYLVLVATAAMLISGKPANAVSLSLGGSQLVTGEGQYTNISGATTINFDNGTAPTSGPVTFSAPGNINTNTVSTSVSGIVKISPNNNGNQSSVYAEPYQDASDYLAVEPNSPVTINFASAVNYFGFYWGSIDAGNELTSIVTVLRSQHFMAHKFLVLPLTAHKAVVQTMLTLISWVLQVRPLIRLF
jgi:hypothetical protein